MTHAGEKHTGELERLGYKYGIAAAVLVFNRQFFSKMVSWLVYGIAGLFPNAAELTDGTTDPGYLTSFIYSELGSYLLPLAVFALLFAREAAAKRSLPAFAEADGSRRFFGDLVLLYVAGWCMASGMSRLTTFVSELINKLFGVPEVRDAFSGHGPEDTFMYVVFAVCMCVVAPVCEELMYRKYLLYPLREYSDAAAVVISALMFSLAHFNFSQFLYTFAFGAALALIVIRSGSVVPAILFHIFNNTLAVFINYQPATFGDAGVDEAYTAVAERVRGFLDIEWYVAFAAVILVLALRMLRLRNTCGVPLKKQFALLLLNPVFLMCAGIILFITFMNLYG